MSFENTLGDKSNLDLLDEVLRDCEPVRPKDGNPKFPVLPPRQLRQLVDYLEWLHPEFSGRLTWSHDQFLTNLVGRLMVKKIIAIAAGDESGPEIPA